MITANLPAEPSLDDLYGIAEYLAHHLARRAAADKAWYEEQLRKGGEVDADFHEDHSALSWAAMYAEKVERNLVDFTA